MAHYEYKTVPAPRRIKRIKGVKGRDASLAQSLEDLIREEATHGWEYHRADTFEIEESGGLFSKTRMVARTLLIFRRPVGAPAPRAAPQPPAPNPLASARPLDAAAEPARAEPTLAPHPSAEPKGPGFSIAGVEPPRSET